MSDIYKGDDAIVKVVCRSNGQPVVIDPTSSARAVIVSENREITLSEEVNVDLTLSPELDSGHVNVLLSSDITENISVTGFGYLDLQVTHITSTLKETFTKQVLIVKSGIEA